MAASGDRSMRSGILGCVGGGGLGLLVFFVVFAWLASQVPSCDLTFEADEERPAGGRSERLPVTVIPRTGLAGGDVVRVTSTAFDAQTVVGVAVCLRKASTEHRGVDACDTRSAARYAVDPDGRLAANFTLPRTITVEGRTYDCAGRPRRCIVVAATVDNSVFGEDFDHSGGQTVEFRPGLAPVPLTPTPPRAATSLLPIVGSPSVAVPADTDIEVLATGFEPGEPVAVAWCHDVDRATSAADACEVLDHDALTGIVVGDLERVPLHADADGRVRTTAAARATISPFRGPWGALAELTADRPGSTVSLPTEPRAEVDCRDRRARCSIVVAAVADIQRSAVLPYELTGD